MAQAITDYVKFLADARDAVYRISGICQEFYIICNGLCHNFVLLMSPAHPEIIPKPRVFCISIAYYKTGRWARDGLLFHICFVV